MGQFRDVLLLSRLKAEGVFHDYAVGGAVAVSLWAEPVATQDLEVIVTTAGDAHPLDRLRETVCDPADAQSPTIRLIRPTYLAAIWQTDQGADTPRRRERAARLREAGLVDETLLTELLSRTKT